MDYNKDQRYVCVFYDSEFHPSEEELIKLLNIHQIPDNPPIKKEETEIIYDR